MTTYFLDTFAGSGSLVGHAPDIAWSGTGASWVIPGANTFTPRFVGTAPTLVGGRATAPDSGVGGNFGDTNVAYGLPNVGVFGFSFTTGPSIVTLFGEYYFSISVGFGFGLPQWMSLQIVDLGDTQGVQFFNYCNSIGQGTNGDLTHAFPLTPSTTYSGTLTITSSSVTVDFGGGLVYTSPYPVLGGAVNDVRQLEVAMAQGFSVDYVYFADAPISVGPAPFVPWWKNYRLTSES